MNVSQIALMISNLLCVKLEVVENFQLEQCSREKYITASTHRQNEASITLQVDDSQSEDLHEPLHKKQRLSTSSSQESQEKHFLISMSWLLVL